VFTFLKNQNDKHYNAYMAVTPELT